MKPVGINHAMMSHDVQGCGVRASWSLVHEYVLVFASSVESRTSVWPRSVEVC
jgi:hypothetical protein